MDRYTERVPKQACPESAVLRKGELQEERRSLHSSRRTRRHGRPRDQEQRHLLLRFVERHRSVEHVQHMPFVSSRLHLPRRRRGASLPSGQRKFAGRTNRPLSVQYMSRRHDRVRGAEQGVHRMPARKHGTAPDVSPVHLVPKRDIRKIQRLGSLPTLRLWDLAQ